MASISSLLPRPPVTPEISHRHAMAVVAVLLLIGGCAAAYVVNPDGIGSEAFVVAAVLCLIAIVIGPKLRGVQSWRFALLPGAAAAFFIVSFVARAAAESSWIAQVRGGDFLSFAGYCSLAVWLRLLSRRYSAPKPQEAIIDTLLTASGASLMLWSLAISPGLGRGDLNLDAFILGVYPVLDVILLTLTAQLLYRIDTPLASAAWFMIGLMLMQVVNLLYTIVWIDDPASSVPILSAAYLFTYASFALGLCHPSVRLLEQGHPEHHDNERGLGGKSVFLVLTIAAPCLTCLLYPSQGTLDTTVRAVLLVLEFVLLNARLGLALKTVKRAERRSRIQSRRDPLTLLSNRADLTRILPAAVAQAHVKGRCFGALMVDFDGFKQINDTWGHAVGDEFLKGIARRLKNSPIGATVCVRLGGDEFFIGLAAASAEEVQRLAGVLLSEFDEPLSVRGGFSTVVTSSIGVYVVAPGQWWDTQSLLRRADVALYEAKRLGKCRVVTYEGELERRDSLRHRLGDDLSGGIRGGQVKAAFQPIVEPQASCRVVGWEALARWQHPQEGFIDPGIFIPLAAERALLNEISLVIWQDALRFIRMQRENSPGSEPQWVSINVSPAQLLTPVFVERLTNELQANPEEVALLRLEITEDTLIPPDGRIVEGIKRLRQMGVGVFLDDFGSGFSGIDALRRLDFDAVKIDRSFLVGEWADEDATVLRAVVDLARSLGVPKIIAEGVETSDEAQRVQSFGVDMAQGWFYGFPQIPEFSTAAQAHLVR